jgi:predicted metal-binding membrane protein
VTIWGALVAVTAIAWIVLARLPMSAASMSDAPWSLRDWWLVFAMWTVMMVAMMLPSAGPMVEMYTRIARRRTSDSIGSAWLFAAGYLIAWTGFSAAITLVQYPLDRSGIIGAAMRMEPLAAGLLLIATGIYQLTPLKDACLSQCRSPLGFFMTKWRSGARGAIAMGLRHGAFCVGCCWLLMALMFVAGAMNLLWAVALTVFVLLEKATSWGDRLARISGAAMLAAGLALAAFG